MKSQNYTRRFFLLRLTIVLIMLLLTWFLYDKLPDPMPMHRNFEGKVDSWGPKYQALLLLPMISFVMVLLSPIFAMIDPKKEKYKQFQKAWQILQTTIVGYLAYFQFVTIYISLNPDKSINTFAMLGVGILFLILGNYMGKIRKNYFVGIKTPWTLDNEEVWNKTHRFGGQMFVLGGLLLIINSAFQVRIWQIFVIAIILMSVIPIVYSYLIFKKLAK